MEYVPDNYDLFEQHEDRLRRSELSEKKEIYDESEEVDEEC